VATQGEQGRAFRRAPCATKQQGSGGWVMTDLVAVLFGLGLGVNALLFVPQAVNILRTRNAQGVSILTFAGFNAMQAIGVLHGWFQKDWSLMAGMGASLLTCGAVTALATIYRGRG
jgi:MtN3 and saliva related transmembrane protein